MPSMGKDGKMSSCTHAPTPIKIAREKKEIAPKLKSFLRLNVLMFLILSNFF
jgi:hypothetical protein